MELVNTRDALFQAQLMLQRELAAIHRCFAMLPAAGCVAVAEQLPSYRDALAAIANGIKELDDDIAERMSEKQQLDCSYRMQKKWRIVSMQACLGMLCTAELKRQAFLDFITEPPSHDELDAELARLAGQLEKLEAAGEEFGELRSITLNP